MSTTFLKYFHFRRRELHNNFQGWYESVLRTPVTYTDIVNYTILLLVDPKEEFFA